MEHLAELEDKENFYRYASSICLLRDKQKDPPAGGPFDLCRIFGVEDFTLPLLFVKTRFYQHSVPELHIYLV